MYAYIINKKMNPYPCLMVYLINKISQLKCVIFILTEQVSIYSSYYNL